jgi:hypothetical protein
VGAHRQPGLAVAVDEQVQLDVAAELPGVVQKLLGGVVGLPLHQIWDGLRGICLAAQFRGH